MTLNIASSASNTRGKLSAMTDGADEKTQTCERKTRLGPPRITCVVAESVTSDINRTSIKVRSSRCGGSLPIQKPFAIANFGGGSSADTLLRLSDMRQAPQIRIRTSSLSLSATPSGDKAMFQNSLFSASFLSTPSRAIR